MESSLQGEGHNASNTYGVNTNLCFIQPRVSTFTNGHPREPSARYFQPQSSSNIEIWRLLVKTQVLTRIMSLSGGFERELFTVVTTD